MLNFENSFAKLPNHFYSNVRPAIVPDPEIVIHNSELSNLLNIDPNWIRSNEGIKCFSGLNLPESSNPLAMVYAGHQFGSWVPQLGDGRAILIGELIDKEGMRWDIQLKGSGRTPYSRSGDGKNTLGPVLREYLISEAMNSLGIPTTRSLAALKTGENIRRERFLPGAIITRVAKSHIRVGTFQYFASRGDVKALKILSDYIINRHFPELTKYENKYLELLKIIIYRQANLIAKWMSVGFIHGVMNTDNTSIIGDTIDYGPCAFMDVYKEGKVFSSIDTYKRYSYKNQPIIGQWNLSQLASSFLPIISNDSEKSLKMAQKEIDKFAIIYEKSWLKLMTKKLALASASKGDKELIKSLLKIMENDNLDYTLTLSSLSIVLKESNYLTMGKKPLCINHIDKSKSLNVWIKKWRKHIYKNNSDLVSLNLLEKVNPSIIPRNHIVENALEDAIQNYDLTKFNSLLDVLKDPFNKDPKFDLYRNPPGEHEEVTKTFCGT